MAPSARNGKWGSVVIISPNSVISSLMAQGIHNLPQKCIQKHNTRNCLQKNSHALKVTARRWRLPFLFRRGYLFSRLPPRDRERLGLCQVGRLGQPEIFWEKSPWKQVFHNIILCSCLQIDFVNKVILTEEIHFSDLRCKSNKCRMASKSTVFFFPLKLKEF